LGYRLCLYEFANLLSVYSVLVYRFIGGDVSFNPNIDARTFDTICSEQKGGQVFDVREPAELETDGRFPNAVNIPLGEVDSAFALSEADFKAKYGVPKPRVTDDNIIFVCKVGKRSLTACKSIEKYGYKKYGFLFIQGRI
uniref:Rhodanese domain-containing protein n=1 Tax=Hydatigena taeniaeformis TaxID=6205 RepID=A0A0R3WKG8_HYDTA